MQTSVWPRLLAGMVLLAVALPSIADDFIVTNANDSGAGSLRQAITDANNHLGADRILFNISGAGTHTIQVGKDTRLALPALIDATMLDATSQPGYAGKPLIELDGSLSGTNQNGIYLFSATSTVKGFVINRFGIGISVASASGCTIQGNYLGTDVAGKIALGNTNFGVAALFAPGTVIGGPNAADRNLISGNHSGVSLGENSLHSQVVGNYIGTDVTGNKALGNTFEGVIIGNAPNHSVVCGNVISANGGTGIEVEVGSNVGGAFQGNYIGVGADGKTALGNGRYGVSLGPEHNDFAIGGTQRGQGNIIAYNQLGGVLNGGGTNVRDSVRGNSIFANGGLGINLYSAHDSFTGVTPNDAGDGDAGPNNLQNYPVLTLATSDGFHTHLVGSLDSLASNSAYPLTLDFFDNTIGDPSGFGEGELYLGSWTLTASGAFTLDLPFGSHLLTATATDAEGNTSEFSEWLRVQQIHSSVPEPEAWAYLGSAMLGLSLMRRRFLRQRN